MSVRESSLEAASAVWSGWESGGPRLGRYRRLRRGARAWNLNRFVILKILHLEEEEELVRAQAEDRNLSRSRPFSTLAWRRGRNEAQP